MAANPIEYTSRQMNRGFLRLYDHYDKQTFFGHPETTRDHVIAAARALAQGNWKRCADLILNLGLWDLVPNSESVKSHLCQKIKLEGLRTYMFAYAAQYDSMSIESLSEMFEMTPREVHSSISKMILESNLYASIDDPTKSVLLHKVDPTPLQSLALQFSTKVFT